MFNPAFAILTLGPVVICLPLWLRRRRRLALMRFAEQKGMTFARRTWPSRVPFPDVANWFWGSAWQNVISGNYRGTPVIAFDIRIGYGRSERYGSGVGIEGVLPEQPPSFSGLKLSRQAAWTFLTTPIGFFRISWHLRPEEMEQLWDTLIDRALTRARPTVHPDPLPGGIHIYPRH